MDSGKTLEVRLPGRDNVVSGRLVLIFCICCTFCICSVVYLWFYVHVVHMYCVHVLQVVLCACGAMYM